MFQKNLTSVLLEAAALGLLWAKMSRDQVTTNTNICDKAEYVVL